MSPRLYAALLTAMTAGTEHLQAQELEPRAYANTPIGLNFAIVGYGYTEGDVLLEAGSPLQDADLTTHTAVFAFARSLDLLGDSGKVDVVLPYAWVSGNATFAGQRVNREVDGFGDPSVRLSWNFIGAPALTLAESRNHQSDWIVGAGLRVGMPLGQYDADKLVNIGANRWSFKPELGVSKTWGRWTVELAAGVTSYTDNTDFFGGQTKEQEPLYALQGHFIRSFGRGVWAGLDATYYTGGRTTVNGIANDDRQESSRIGLTVSVPITTHQSLKFYASTGTSARVGGDFSTVGLAWQYRWGGGEPAKPSP